MVLSALGGIGFIAAVNIAVSLSGPTVTGFVAPLYAVAAALLAIPILGEHIRPTTAAAFGVAVIGTALLAGVDPTRRLADRGGDGRRSRGDLRALHGARSSMGTDLRPGRDDRHDRQPHRTRSDPARVRGHAVIGERDPGASRTGGRDRPAVDRVRLELDGQSPAHGERSSDPGATDIGGPAPDADLVRGPRRGAARRDLEHAGVDRAPRSSCLGSRARAVSLSEGQSRRSRPDGRRRRPSGAGSPGSAPSAQFGIEIERQDHAGIGGLAPRFARARSTGPRTHCRRGPLRRGTWRRRGPKPHSGRRPPRGPWPRRPDPRWSGLPRRGGRDPTEPRCGRGASGPTENSPRS